MIKFSCKNCGQKLNVDDKQSGRQVKCPKCHNIVIVPTRETIPEQRELPSTSIPQKTNEVIDSEKAEKSEESYSVNYHLKYLIAIAAICIVGLVLIGIWWSLRPSKDTPHGVMLGHWKRITLEAQTENPNYKQVPSTTTLQDIPMTSSYFFQFYAYGM